MPQRNIQSVFKKCHSVAAIDNTAVVHAVCYYTHYHARMKHLNNSTEIRKVYVLNLCMYTSYSRS